MNVRMKFDTSKIEEAIRQLAPHVKKSRRELVEQAAKGFVRTVVEVTPPASKGRSGSTARKQGEAVIKSGLARVMVAVRSRRDRLESAEAIYKRLRDPRTGRINPRNLKAPYPVPAAEYNALRKKLIDRVGWLAAGWNAAAKQLGVRLPAWITRHGTSAGIVNVTNNDRCFRIEISNAVKFVGSVKSLDTRIQRSVDLQAKAMQRQADFLLRKAVKRAGF